MTARRWTAALIGGLLVGAMIIAATASLDHVFSDTWLPRVSVPALVGLLAAEVVRGLGGRIWMPLMAGAIAGGITAARTWWGHTLAAGWIPTRETASALVQDLSKTQSAVRIEQSPIEPHLHVLSVLSLAVLLIALLVELIALGLRSPAVAGVPALGILGAGAILSGEMTPLLALMVASAAWLGLLAVSDLPSLHTRASRSAPVKTGGSAAGLGPVRPGRSPLRNRFGSAAGTVLASGCALTVLAVSATQIAPITTGLAPEGHRFFIHGPVDPASDLSDALRQGSGPVGIEYRSSTGLGVYLRTAVVHDVTASRWVPRETGGGVPPNGDVFDPSGKVLRDIGASSAWGFNEELEEALLSPSQETVQLQLTDYRGSRLPVADQPVGQDGVATEQGWASRPRTATVQRDGTAAVNLDYESRYWTLPLGADEMTTFFDGMGIPGPDTYFGLEVPNQSAVGSLVSDPELQGTRIQAQAQEITTAAASPLEVGQLLQEHFQSGDYEYSETAPSDEGYDGTGIEITEQFLDARSGYCIHYASAMALMARSVDVPARIVVGYAPIGPDADGVHRVEARLAHAWPELYMAGLGWVPFEPTPTVGRAPSYTLPDSGPAPEEIPTTAPSPTQVAEPTPSVSPTPETGSGVEDTSTDGISMQTVLTVLGAVLAVGAAAALTLTPHLIRSRRRRHRLHAAAQPSASVRSQVLAAWHEVEDTAMDLGLSREEHESEQAFSRRLAHHITAAEQGPGDDARSGLTVLARSAEWARYASEDSTPPEGADEAPTHAAAVVQVMESSANPAVRRRAWWLPTSLVRR